MATRTSYQKQADYRIKKAVRIRNRADAKVRRYAQLLSEAMDTLRAAGDRMDAVNTLYGTSYNGVTQLFNDLKTSGTTVPNLRAGLTASAAGVPAVTVVPQADANGGALLAPDPLVD